MGKKDEYNPQGSADAVEQINPFTDDWASQLQGFFDQFQTGMGSYGPEASLATMEGAQPGISQMAQQMIQPYADSQNTMAENMANQAVRATASQFARPGLNLQSGAFGEAAGAGMMNPIQQAVTNIAQMQGNLGGQLMGGFQNQLGQAYGTNAGLLGQAMGQGGQLGATQFWEPTHVKESENWFQRTFA